MTRRKRRPTSAQEIAVGIGLPIACVFAYFSHFNASGHFNIFALVLWIIMLAGAVVGFVLIVKFFTSKPLYYTRDEGFIRYPSPLRQEPSYGSRPGGSRPEPDNRFPEPVPRRQMLTEETLRRLDWLAFEHLVVDLFNHLEFRAKKTGAGADGGVDIELYQKQPLPDTPPSVLIQCKARANAMVGVDRARELYGVMASRGIRSGILICNTTFSADAYAFSKANPSLRLGDLSWVMIQINKVPQEVRLEWERRYFGPDYDVPSCPACEIKLVRRTGRKGEFWGCSNYPRGCRTRLPMRAEDMGS